MALTMLLQLSSDVLSSIGTRSPLLPPSHIHPSPGSVSVASSVSDACGGIGIGIDVAELSSPLHLLLITEGECSYTLSCLVRAASRYAVDGSHRMNTCEIWPDVRAVIPPPTSSPASSTSPCWQHDPLRTRECSAGQSMITIDTPRQLNKDDVDAIKKQLTPSNRTDGSGTTNATSANAASSRRRRRARGFDYSFPELICETERPIEPQRPNPPPPLKTWIRSCELLQW